MKCLVDMDKKVLTRHFFSGNIIEVVSGKRLRQVIQKFFIKKNF